MSVKAEKRVKEEAFDRSERKTLTGHLRKVTQYNNKPETKYTQLLEDLSALSKKLASDSRQELEDISRKLDKYSKPIDFFSEQERNKNLKTALIAGAKYILAQNIKDVGEAIIQQTNQLEDICFAKDRKEEPSDKAEGSKVKQAVKILKSFNEFIGLMEEQDVDKRKERYKKLISKVGTEFYFINGLKHLDIGLKKDTSYTPEIYNPLVDKYEAIKKDENQKYTQLIGQKIGELYDYPRTGKEHQDVENKLYKTSARHLVIILLIFRNFKHLPNSYKNKLEENFIKYILHAQKWDKHKKNIDDKSENLLASDVSQGIHLYARIDYEENVFKMVRVSEAGDARNSPSNSGEESISSTEENLAYGFRL